MMAVALGACSSQSLTGWPEAAVLIAGIAGIAGILWVIFR